MRASTSRTIFCAGLFVLAACAVLPAPVQETATAVATTATVNVEVRLAQSIRDRIELDHTLPARHPERIAAAADEQALRELAFADDSASRSGLIDALADQLSLALAERRAAAETADTKRHAQVETVISALIAAINAEVHNNRT